MTFSVMYMYIPLCVLRVLSDNSNLYPSGLLVPLS